MKVGLYLVYDRSDPTYAVLQATRVALDLGHDVELLAANKPNPVHPFWDRRLVESTSFVKWLQGGVDYLLFAQAPPKDLVVTAHSRGIKVYYSCFWDELEARDAPGLGSADKVICPAKCVARLLQDKLKVTNTVTVPWDPGVPLTHSRRDIDPERVGLLWVLDGAVLMTQDLAVLKALEATLDWPNVWTTALYSNLTHSVVKELKRLAQAADGRMELVRDGDWDRQHLLYGRHDLTVWPSLVEGSGLPGLCSLYMGTPVVSWDYPLMGEMIKDGHNGVLVPCDLNFGWLDIPYVEPDFDAFVRHLAEAVRPDTIAHLAKSTAAGLSLRREKFNRVWSELFSL